MIILSTHAVFLDGHDIYGPPHAVAKYLIQKNSTFLFIKHDLTECRFSVIEFFHQGILKKTLKIPYKKTQSLIAKSWQEIQLTTAVCSLVKVPVVVFVGANIVNALAGFLLYLRGKIVKTIFLSADFAHSRFSGFVTNALYHIIDFFIMHVAHQTWSISSRIVACRKSRFLSDKKNILFPNAPFFNSISRNSFKNLNHTHIVIVSALENGIDFISIFEAFSEVLKRHSSAQLHVIGSGSKKAELEAYALKLKINQAVIFHGALDHDAMFSVLTQCGIGIALYTDSDFRHFRYFSDPMKVRDYMASGLAVLLSGNSALTEEIVENEAGFAVKQNKEDLLEKMLLILSDKKLHEKLHHNAVRQASKYDTEKNIEKHLYAYL